MKENNQSVYEQNIQDIFRYAMYHLGNREKAEDITSDTFTAYYEKKDRDQIINPKAWLITVARNLIYKSYRRGSKTSSLDQVHEKFGFLPVEGDDFTDEILTQELVAIIKQEISNLDPELQEIIILRIWENMKFREIAEVVGEKVSTVKLRYYRALKKIKSNLSEHNKDWSGIITLSFLRKSIYKISKSKVYVPSNELLKGSDSGSSHGNKETPPKSPSKSLGVKFVLVGVGVLSLVVVGVVIFFITELGNREISTPESISEAIDDELDDKSQGNGDEGTSDASDVVLPLEEAGRVYREMIIDCIHFYEDPPIPGKHRISLALLGTEEVQAGECQTKVTGEGYSLDILIVFEGSPFFIEDEAKLPGVVEVETPNLDVSFLESDVTKSVVRIEAIRGSNEFYYYSYYAEGVSECSYWGSINGPVIACGVSGLNLKTIIIDVTCKVDSYEKTQYCDEIMETLSIVNLEN